MAFKNPTGYWEYNGTYTVKLTENAALPSLPTGYIADSETMTVSVDGGRIKQVMGGIQLYDRFGNPVHWGYKFLKEIRDDQGELIWRNRDYIQ